MTAPTDEEIQKALDVLLWLYAHVVSAGAKTEISRVRHRLNIIQDQRMERAVLERASQRWVCHHGFGFTCDPLTTKSHPAHWGSCGFAPTYPGGSS